MAYQSEPIVSIINRLNIRYFLPAIQREFVWSTEQIIELFDSILRGYPISSFLFWELKPENRDKWEVYKFIQHFRQGGTHNELANTAGVQQVNLVLDGQQRLTSLLIGLKGTFTIKTKYRRWDNPEAWVKHSLYLDLLKNPDEDPDDDTLGVRYGLRFLDKEPPDDKDHYWFKLSRILDFDSEDAFDAFRFQERAKIVPSVQPGVQEQIFEKNLHRLYQAMWRRDVISYYTEPDQNYDRVLDIFVRANEGGTKLSKSDLLLAMITSKWSGVNARDEIYSFVDRLNFALTRKNNFDKDFVMKTCLVLSDLPVQYKVQNFNNHNLGLIHSHWTDIKRSLEKAVNLVNSFGIDRDNLTSANALIPIAYYLFQHPSVTLDGGSSFEVSNAFRIRTWLLMALLNNVFGGQSDSMLRDIRAVLQEHTAEKDFSLDAINRKIADAGRTASFDDNAVDQFLAHTYGGQGTTLALTLLYEDNNWGNKQYHQDHIFPRSLFTPTRLTRAGIAADKQEAYLNAVDYIGNLELLLEHENIKKSNQPFDEWLVTRDASFKERHLIPADPELYTLDRFLDFIDQREALIKRRLTTLFGSVSVGMKRPTDTTIPLASASARSMS